MLSAAPHLKNLMDDPCMIAGIVEFPRQEHTIKMTQSGKTSQIPAEQAQQLRQLSHDLSNAFEIILQTSFLLGTVALDENAQQWRQMLDQGVQQATKINQELREYIRVHTENAAV
jgi:sugar (pentulose or hexulose) kinase